MTKKAKPRDRYVVCRNCRRRTNHEVVGIHNQPNFELPSFQTHMLLSCKGCDTVCYCIEDGDCEDIDQYSGELNVLRETYPAEEVFEKKFKKSDLPLSVWTVYVETISALNAQLPVLAGIGLRTLIEAICRDRRVKAKDLEERIDKLHTAGVLSEANAKMLHSHRFLGNIATHEFVGAQPQELEAAVEIAETVMNTIYRLPKLADSVKTGWKPPRPKSTPKKAVTKPAAKSNGAPK